VTLNAPAAGTTSYVEIGGRARAVNTRVFSTPQARVDVSDGTRTPDLLRDRQEDILAVNEALQS